MDARMTVYKISLFFARPFAKGLRCGIITALTYEEWSNENVSERF